MFKKLAFIFILGILLTGIVPKNAEAKASDEPPQEFANVVLFAYFRGDTAGREHFEKQETRDKYLNEIYGTARSQSFTNYMGTISYGKFNVKNIFPQDTGSSIQAAEVNVTEAEAMQGNCDARIIQELLGKISGIQDQIIDYDEDGRIDNLTVILYSTSLEGDSTSTTLYPHKSDYPDQEYWSEKKIGTYNMLNTARLNSISGGAGLVAHEFLHSLGYPDLYTASESDVPVGIWDIMSKVAERPSYPLAYLRMHFSRWLDIETITSSQSLTLDKQDKADGNQAYILKSPLNENELFVVEFRKREANSQGTYEIDGSVIYPGVIVYRIDTTVETLTNQVGKYGVYVFRPQNSSSALIDAVLSKETGRMELGSEDLNKTLEDGAITFSDGTNSGIVIRNVSSSSGDQMTLDVTIPDASQFDLWTDTGFDDKVAGTVGNNKKVSLANIGNDQYLMAYEAGTYTLYQYDGNRWMQKGNGFSRGGTLFGMRLFINGTELWLATNTMDTNSPSSAVLTFWKYNFQTGTWQSVTSAPMGWAEFDVRSVGGKVYAVYITEDNKAVLAAIEDSSVQTLGTYFSEYCAQPQICDINGQIYVSVRKVKGNVIEVYSYGSGSGFTRISGGTICGNTYDLDSRENKICVAVGGENLRIDTYEGGVWRQGALSGINCFSPALVTAQGNLYVLVTPQTDKGNLQVYQYDTSNCTYIKEGVDVDSDVDTMCLSSVDNQLYVAYVRHMDTVIKVKVKDIADVLLSIVVIPPAKVVYQKGEKVDLTGFLLTASYRSGMKTLGAAECQIAGFDTNTAGKRTATVTYGGKSAAFSYEVWEKEDSGAGTGGADQPETPKPAGVFYRTHVQSFGWQEFVGNGIMSGTSGKAKRLEGIEIKLDTAANLGIQYTTHCQTYGWLPWSSNGEMNGTTGESKRLEAVKIQLTGADKDKYDVYYRVHAQTYGWLNWAKNGEEAGTAGYAKRLEGIQIVIVLKGGSFDRNMQGISSKENQRFVAKTGGEPAVSGADSTNTMYRTHVQSYGWQGWKYNGQMSGTSGESKRLEGIELRLTNQQYEGGIEYRTHVQTIGWQEWRANGSMSGTSGQAKRLEAIEIKLTGTMESRYDIYYRVHAQKFGWMGWAENGAPAGTAGYAYRLEGIEIKLVPKGAPAPGSTANAFRSR